MDNLPDVEDFGDSVSILDSSSIVPRNYDQYDEMIEENENRSEDEETNNNENELGYEALKDDEFGNFVGFEGEITGNLKQLASETVVSAGTESATGGSVEIVEDTGIPRIENRASIPPLTTGSFYKPFLRRN